MSAHDAKGVGPSGQTRRWRRPPVSLMVLLLGILLLMGAVWQALGARRTQERTVTRVLQSYASMAAWNFEQQATATLRSVVEDVFHRELHAPALHDGSLTARGTMIAHPAEIVTDRTDLTKCAHALVDAARAALRIPLRGNDVVATRVLDDAFADAVAAELRAHHRMTAPGARLTGHEVMHAFTLGDSAHVAVYSSKLVPGDTLLYALILDPARLSELFDLAAGAENLLPEPLVARADAAELLAFSITMPDSSSTVFGTAPVTSWTAARALPKLGGIIAIAELKPGAESHLILADAGLIEGRFLLAILALAIGLLVIAFSQIRREYALARMRSDFVSSVSHELRTPLALQRVFLDMLKLGRVHTDDRRQWCFDNIDRESIRLAHLVENVLHFSRSEQGTMQVRAERARLAPLIDEIVRAFEPLTATSRTPVRVKLDSAVSAPVDPRALRQVLMNLLENAVKYGAAGAPVEVTLELRGQVARILVDDAGRGVPPEERALIFEPYRRGRATLDSAIAGSGIGLAVVRQLVSGHGGRIFVADSPAGGARFVVELPDARLESDAVISTVEPENDRARVAR